MNSLLVAFKGIHYEKEFYVKCSFHKRIITEKKRKNLNDKKLNGTIWIQAVQKPNQNKINGIGSHAYVPC